MSFPQAAAEQQIGSMDASEGSTYNRAVDWYVPVHYSSIYVVTSRYSGRGYWFSPPSVQFVHDRPVITWTSSDDGANAGHTQTFSSMEEVYDLQTRRKSAQAAKYRQSIQKRLENLVTDDKRKFGAVIIEPICLGAGGMVFVDPLFQECLVEVVRANSKLFGGQESNKAGQASEGHRNASQWRGLPIIYDEGAS